MAFFNKLKKLLQEEKKVISYRPLPKVSRKNVEVLLDQLSEDALTTFFKENNKNLYNFEESEEERYRKYESLSLEELRIKAESGDAAAQYLVGDYYAKQDSYEGYAEAAKWFLRGAERNNADAMYMLGIFYLNGWGVKTDFERAEKYLLKASEYGLAYPAAAALKDMYWEQNGFESIKKSLPWIALLAWSTIPEQDGLEDIDIASTPFYLCTMIGFDTSFNLNAEHTELAEYEQKEQYALIAYYWEKRARIFDRINWEDRPDMEKILCFIGESALELKKAYAIDVLGLAEEEGSDYAAILRAVELIKKAFHEGASSEELENHPAFKRYLNLARKLVFTSDETCKREKAHALVALANFYVYGAGCQRDFIQAYHYVKQAADMNYGMAQHLLESFVRQSDGTYRINLTGFEDGFGLDISPGFNLIVDIKPEVKKKEPVKTENEKTVRISVECYKKYRTLIPLSDHEIREYTAT